MTGTAETADARPETGLDAFIRNVVASGGAERANYQLFIIDLCEVLGLPRLDYSREDTALDDYVFERRVTFRHPDGSTTPGFIDCYRRGCFVLEAKQSRKRASPDDSARLPLLGEESNRRTGTGVRGGRA